MGLRPGGTHCEWFGLDRSRITARPLIPVEVPAPLRTAARQCSGGHETHQRRSGRAAAPPSSWAVALMTTIPNGSAPIAGPCIPSAATRSVPYSSKALQVHCGRRGPGPGRLWLSKPMFTRERPCPPGHLHPAFSRQSDTPPDVIPDRCAERLEFPAQLPDPRNGGDAATASPLRWPWGVRGAGRGPLLHGDQRMDRGCPGRGVGSAAGTT